MRRQRVETALWEALRALEKSASLYRRMAERGANSHHDQSAQLYQERASDTEANSRVLRDFLLQVNVGEDPERASHEHDDSPQPLRD